jgi:hypothetical protein
MPPQNPEFKTLRPVVISFDGGFPARADFLREGYSMDDCQCDVVPDKPIRVRTETTCPVCHGRVTFLSAEDFELVLKAVHVLQSNDDAAGNSAPTES